MDETPADRLKRVEASLAHLERLCEELNQVVVEQGKALARLQAQQRNIAETMSTIEMERIKSTTTRPPHYQ